MRHTAKRFHTADFTRSSSAYRLARFHPSPRYLLHGVAAVISVAAISSIAFQPRLGVSTAAAVADAAPAMADLDIANVAPASTPAPAMAQPVNDVLEATIAPPEPPQPITHTVEDGESVRMLAAKYGISPETLMAANGIQNADLLQVGQDLVILPTDGVLYTLKAGESVQSVAQRFNVDAGDIVRANVLGPNPDMVQPGTKLVVPGASPMLQPSGSSSDGSGDGTDQVAATANDGTSAPLNYTAGAVPSTRTYEVQPGDTLASIASTFGVDVPTILASNGIDDPDSIHPGSQLSILPVKGVSYQVEPDETLADIAYKYQVDLGLLLDYNNLNDPDMINVGDTIVVPGGRLRVDAAPAPVVPAVSAPAPAAIVQAPAPKPAAPAPASASKPAAAAPAPKPAAPAPAPAPKPAAPAAPAISSGGGGGGIVANAMQFVGDRYVFGGTSPSGFDCSGFVYYVLNHSGVSIGRSMWQQYNAGAHVSQGSLQPGDIVFFANTYEPGLSHDGIYIGNGQFVHAADESTGVTVSSLGTSYWQGHWAGAMRP